MERGAQEPHRPEKIDRVFVDLDGSVIASDLTWECLVRLLRTRPLDMLRVPIWLLKGRAYFNQELAKRCDLNPGALPYRQEVLAVLREERKCGMRIVLITAADHALARRVADHLDLASGILASHDKISCTGERRLAAILKEADGKPFGYIGNARKDSEVWKAASQLTVVALGESTANAVRNLPKARIVHCSGMRFGSWLRAIRVHQWAKNLLLFVPLITAHQFGNWEALVGAASGFLSFSLCASAAYVFNDLLDLDSDRTHATKRARPFASGEIPISWGVGMMVLLFCFGVVLAALTLPPLFLGIVLLYGIVTTSYSLYLKRIPVLDVLVLAGLYTVRVIGGGVAVSISISQWLLAFSMFLFLSLACMKRFTELVAIVSSGGKLPPGRGYEVADRDLLQMAGIVSGYLAILVLALYLNSREVIALYKNHQVLWLMCPPLLFWVTRVWLLAHRGEMNEDPVTFAIHDRQSYVVGVLVGLTMFAAL